MREIKFRYWDTDGMMSRPFTLQETTGKENWKKLIPMQFTGVKDKNGKEIYEGDIVKVTSSEESRTGPVVIYDSSFVVRLDRAEFPLFHSLFNPYQGTLLSCDNPFEVLGNIYENKDLLEEKKGEES